MRIHFHVDGKTPSINNSKNTIDLDGDCVAALIQKNMAILSGLDQQMIDSASRAE